MKEMKDEMEQHQIALSARLMSKALRKLTALNKNALLIFINQIRINVGAYGNPEITTGGKALGHYASVRVEIRKGEPLRESKKQIGQVVKFKVTKNKTASPYGDGYFKFFSEGRIDKIDELVTLGLMNEKIQQKGAFYSIAGKRIRGREALEMELEGDSKFFDKAKAVILT
jgi:recombination protein RecA